VVPGVLELCVTLRVPQLGQRLRIDENVSPHRRHLTSGIMPIYKFLLILPLSWQAEPGCVFLRRTAPIMPTGQ